MIHDRLCQSHLGKWNEDRTNWNFGSGPYLTGRSLHHGSNKTVLTVVFCKPPVLLRNFVLCLARALPAFLPLCDLVRVCVCVVWCVCVCVCVCAWKWSLHAHPLRLHTYPFSEAQGNPTGSLNKYPGIRPEVACTGDLVLSLVVLDYGAEKSPVFSGPLETYKPPQTTNGSK